MPIETGQITRYRVGQVYLPVTNSTLLTAQTCRTRFRVSRLKTLFAPDQADAEKPPDVPKRNPGTLFAPDQADAGQREHTSISPPPDSDRPGRFPTALACLALLVGVLLTSVFFNPYSHAADVSVPADWTLIPGNISAGERFRLMIATRMLVDAGDSDIAYYNQIVKSDIYFLGHPAIQKYRNGFKALVSTEEVDARDNTETTGTGVPIYWLNGRKIYDNYIDLYDGNDPYNTSLGTNTSGNRAGFHLRTYIWTGSKANGTESTRLGKSGAVGSGDWVKVGVPGWADPQLLSAPDEADFHMDQRRFFPIYGLSPVFRVAPGPAVAFDRASQDAPESAGTRNVRVNLSPAPQSDLTLNYSVGGTATAGSGNDFTIASSGSVAVPSGANNVNIPVAIRDDRVDENDETVILTLTRSASYTVGGAAVHTLTIGDNDTRGVTVSKTDLTIAEGATGAYTVVLTSAPTGDVMITLSSDNPDVTLSDALTFTSANWDSAQTVTVTAAEDEDVADDSARVTHTVTGACRFYPSWLCARVTPKVTGYSGVTAAAVAVTVTDDDLVSTLVALSVVPQRVGESDGATTVTVTATLNGGARDSTVSLTVTVGSGTATSSVDFTTVQDVPLTIDGGERSGSGTFILTPTVDTTDEADETVAVSATTTASGLSVSGTEITITDDDDTPQVTLALASAISEDGGATAVTATLDRASSEETTVTVSASPVAPAVTGDYTRSGDTLTIAAGDTTSTGTVTLTAVDNEVDASDKSVTVSATVDNSRGAKAPTDALLTITDEDVRGVTVSSNMLTIAEGATGTYEVVLTSAPTGGDVTITLSSDNTDVTLSDALAFTSANWNSAQTVTVTAAEDNDANNDSATITHTLTGGDYGKAGVTAAAVAVTVTDNDDDSTLVALSVVPQRVGESDGATTVTVTATLNGGARDSTVSLTVTVGSGTATSSVDFTTVQDVPLTIDGGKRSGSGTFILTPTVDTTDEADETVAVSATTTASGLSVSGTEITITDDDDTPQVTLALASAISEDGGATAVTATLDRASSEETTVTISASPVAPAVTGDYTRSGDTLTIAAGDTTSTGTVTLTAVDNEVDASDKSVTVSATVDNSRGAKAPTDALLTITDEDVRGVTVSSNMLTIAEGATGTYEVVLTSAPTGGDVTITLSSDNTDVTLSDALAFTSANWNSAQTVTVTAAEDNDANNDSATITHTLTGGDYGKAGVTAAAVAVTVTDNDDDSTLVALSVVPQRVGESDGATTVTVTATLNGGARDSTVSLTVTVGSGTATSSVDFTTVQDVPLTIDGGERSGSGTFILTPTVDTTDEADETVAVSATTTASGLSVSGTEITITDDDDTPQVTLALASAISEDGGATAVTATLDRASSEETTVTVSASPVAPAVTGDYTRSGDTLTIAAGDTTSTGTVTLTAVDNEVDASDKSVTVSATVDNSRGAKAPTDALLTITDEDVRGVTVSSNMLTIAEGATGTYEVVLTSAPTGGDVTITLSSDNTDVTLSDALAFTSANWNSAQTVTVTAAEDNDANNDSATITHTLTGGDYGKAGVTAAAVAVTVTDNDDDSTLVALSVVPQRVGESDGATTVTVTATLNGGARDSTVSLTVTVGSGTATSSVDFTTVQDVPLTIDGGKRSGSGTFILTPTVDTTDEADETVAVSATTTASGLSVSGTEITITDDDDTPQVTLALASAISEDGGATAVTATLDRASSEETTVTISASPVAPAVTGDYTRSGDTLTIAAGDTTSTGTVTLTAVDNEVDASDKSVTVSATVDNSRGAKAPTDALLTITDEDVRGVTVSSNMLTIAEGATGTYEVVLTSAPTGGDVTITLSSDNTDVTLSDALAFTSANWNSAQTVTVTAAEDNDANNDSATITHTLTGGDYGKAGVTAAAVAVTVTDNDDDSTLVALSVVPQRVGESDGATTVTVTATLNGGARDSTVSLTVTVGSGTATSSVDFTTVQDVPLTIDGGERSGSGTFILTPTVDTTDEADETVAVSATTTASGLSVSGTEITITDDDDTPQVTLALASAISEDGGATAVTATLDRASSEETTVTVSASPVAPAVTGDYTRSGDTLTIAAGDTTSTGTVTLTAVDNEVDASDKSVTVSATVDNSRGAKAPTDALLTITDEDVRGVTVSSNMLTIAEGATGTYEVVLTSAPTGGDVTITLSSDNTDVTLSDALAFTSANWNSAQTVTVTAAEDNDANNDSATITHTLTGGDYGKAGVTAAAVAVTVTDNDQAGVTVSPGMLTVTEGATGAYTVVLTSAPTGEVTITPSSDNPEVTLSDALAFTSANWNSAQTVTVTATGDEDAANDHARVTHTVTGYPGVTAAEVAVTVNDDEVTAVTLTGSAGDITEGGTKAFTVNLSRGLVDGESLVAPLTLTGSATRGTDYRLACASATGVACAGLNSGSATVTFTGPNSGKTATSMTITLTATADLVAETTAETVSIGLGTLVTTGLDGGATTTDDLADFSIVDPGPGVPAATFARASQDAPESAGTRNVRVNLNLAPQSAITLSYRVGGTATAGSGNDFTIANFGSVAVSSGANNVNIPVAIRDDRVDENDETVILTLTQGAGYTVGGAAVHTLTVTDNDLAGVALAPTKLTVAEGGVAIYEVVLVTQPTGDVTITPSSDNMEVVTIPNALTFTRANWNQVQTVTVTAVGDEDATDDSARVTHMVMGGSYGSEMAATVAVAVIETPVVTVMPQVTLALDSASISEDGGVSAVTATLDRALSTATTVTVSANPVAPAVAGDYTLSGAALTIAAGDTASTGTVTLTAIDNDVDASDKTMTVSVTVSNSQRVGAPTDVTLTVTDDDTRGVRVSQTALTINEGATGSYTVTLTSAPSGEVMIAPSSDNPDVTLSPPTLTFTADNWDSAKAVTVSAAEDRDATDDRASITHTVSGADYESASAEPVAVTVTDYDPGGHDVSAWLARFARTVTDQVLDAVTDRLAAPRSPGMTVSLAGRALPTQGQDNAVRGDRPAGRSPAGNAAGSLRASLAERGAMDALSNWISHTGAEGDDLPDGAPGAGSLALQSWSPTGRDWTSGTSFALTGEPRADGTLLSVWGRGAMSNFAGRDGDLTLDGEVQTLLGGAERSRRGWTTGGVLGRSRAEGGYRSAAETGEIEATLTGVYPWVGRAVNDQVSAWAALGYGTGDLTLKPEGGGRIRTPLSLALGAAGLRGEVLRPLEAGGLSLAVKGDVRFTRAASKAARDAVAGRLMAAGVDVWRVRAGVEGARSFMANDDAWATITPSFEVGVRLDGGDAETGFGADVGGGVALVDPGRGVTLEMKARGLAAHEDEGFREWGASAALVWEPRPQGERGLSLSLTQSWGASSSGGMDALLSRDTLVGLAANDTAPDGRRLEAELGYGMAVFGGDFTGTPNAALTVTEGGRDWRLGWRLTPAWPDGSGFEVNLDVLRREADGEAPAHAVMLRGAIRF